MASDYADVSERLKKLEIQFWGHSHVDMEWQWAIQETSQVLKNTWNGVLDAITRSPYGFVASQIAGYELMEREDPALLGGVRKAIQEGRWSVVGGMWVESDQNLPCGESIVRQLLLGKRYAKERLGAEVTIGWNPDSFGHPANLPQILRKAEIDAYVFFRGRDDWGPFWWEGLDGSRVLGYRPPEWYLRVHLNPRNLLGEMKAEEARGLAVHGSCYGLGDHGGHPPFSEVNRNLQLAEHPLFPKVRWTHPKEYLDAAAKSAKDLPVVRGEMLRLTNPQLYGTYTTHSNVKYRNRILESAALDAELLNSLAPEEEAFPYPREAMTEAWRDLCFNQFHDILPGSAIPAVFGPVPGVTKTGTARERGLLAYDRFNTLRSEGLGKLAIEIDRTKFPPGVGTTKTRKGEARTNPVVVFNPLSWTRSGPVRLLRNHLMFQPKKPVIRDDAGNVYAGQVVYSPRFIVYRVPTPDESYAHQEQVLFIAKDVPPVGYRVLWLEDGEIPATDLAIDEAAGTLTNERLKVVLDPKTGDLASVRDLKLDRELLAAPGNGLLFREDKGDAWIIRYTKRAERYDGTEPPKIQWLEKGPVRATVEIRSPYRGSTLIRRVSLYAGIPKVFLEFDREWKDDCDEVFVRNVFPFAVPGAVARFEIPYGSVTRPAYGHEVPAQTWVDLSAPDGSWGVTLTNNGRHGFSVKDPALAVPADFTGWALPPADAPPAAPVEAGKGTILEMGLLRDPPDGPDPQPEDEGEGRHILECQIVPHTGDWAAGEAWKHGWEANRPLLAGAMDVQEGRSPQTRSHFSVEGDGVVIAAVKKAEDSKRLVVRVFQATGKDAQVTLRYHRPVLSASIANLLEKPGDPLTPEKDGTGGRVTFPIKGFGIETILIEEPPNLPPPMPVDPNKGGNPPEFGPRVDDPHDPHGREDGPPAPAPGPRR